MNKFDDISVRDENSARIVSALTGRDVEYHLDPVLIYDFEKEITDKPELENYILIYGYGNRFSDISEITAIKQFAKTHNKRTVSVGYHQDWVDEKLEGSPFELLSYFKYADYVITDTFHGGVIHKIS